MSDLRNLNEKELEWRKISCESEIERLQEKLDNEKKRLMWIGVYLGKRKEINAKAKVAKFMKRYEGE